MTRQPTRPFALLTVVILHAAGLYALLAPLPLRRSAPESEPPAMLMTFLEVDREVPRDVPDAPAPHAPPRISQRNQPPPPGKQPIIEPPPDASSAIAPSAPGAITDWRVEAQSSADGVLRQKRQDAARRGFAHEYQAEPPPDKPGVFGSSQQNDRAGTVEDGERFWVTDNCYFDFERGPPPPRMAGEFHLKTRICKPPPTGGGNRMFEQLTPDYLKKPTEPKDK